MVLPSLFIPSIICCSNVAISEVILAVIATMSRPKINPEQHLRAYRLWRAGHGPTEIGKTLEAEFPEETVSARTVATWVKGFKALRPEAVDPDAPFQWHLMGDWGLPWEASGFILDMLSAVYASNYLQWASNTNTRLTPTVREALWWWRVHQAAPEIAREVGYQSDIHALASHFVSRELAHEVLGSRLELADLEVCLALKPWLDDEHHRHYHEMVKSGVVPSFEELRLKSMSDLVQKFLKPGSLEFPGWYIEVFPVDPDHPELLWSQQWARRKARLRRWLHRQRIKTILVTKKEAEKANIQESPKGDDTDEP